jgi:hypothetical protein
MQPKFEIVRECIKKRIAAGEFRKTDPTVVARIILGAAIYHRQVLTLYGWPKKRQLGGRKLSRLYSDVLYAGLKP